MKKTVSLMCLTFMFLLLLSQPNGFAEDTTRWRLPEGATVRLRKGSIKQIAYSPNGMHLAGAGSTGIWLYDVTISQAVALLTENTGPVSSFALCHFFAFGRVSNFFESAFGRVSKHF